MLKTRHPLWPGGLATVALAGLAPAVPEPGTWTLWSVGLGGLIARRRQA